MKILREIPLNKRAFELIDGACYVFEYAIEEAGLSTNYYRKEKCLKNNRLQFLNHPKDKRFTLVAFETISPAHQEKIRQRWNDPYEYVTHEPIRQLVQIDVKAEQFFNDYRYDDNKQLPIEHRNKYTIAASWLNMLIALMDDKKYIKNELHLSLEKFWTIVCEIIDTDKINLPSSYRRLVANEDSALKKYKEQNYSSLIDWRFGNKLSAKIGKSETGYNEVLAEKQMAVIRKLARLHMNLDAVQIQSFANVIFEKNGWQTVSSSTIQNIIATNMPSIMPGRKGVRKYNNTVAMQVVRESPQFPAYYWTLDGWTVELLYKEGNKFDNRLVVVVVVDAMNKYPIGFAIGDRENSELIRMALRNAIIHMQELFGATYRPWQLQSDRYALKNLTPFYGAVAHLHTPAAVGNAKSKIIEPYFKYINDTYCKLQFNWSGHNITAKSSNQPNTEMLDKIKHNFPDKKGVMMQVMKIIAKERSIKINEYKAAWDAMPLEDKVTLSPEDCLMVFGVPHKETNSITGHGLIATLKDSNDKGQRMIYDSFDPAFRALQFTTNFQLVYDPEDLNQVLALTEDGKQRFLLHSKMKVGMGFKNTTPEQLEYHQQIRDFNTDRREEIMQQYIADDNTVMELVANTPLSLTDNNEVALKTMLTFNGQQKERLQDAKGLKSTQDTEAKQQRKQLKESDKNWNDLQDHYLKTKNDFNKYLD